jgi:hypothetical protein
MYKLLRQCNALQALDSRIMELSVELLGNGPKSMANFCTEMYQDDPAVKAHLQAAGAKEWLMARPETFVVYRPNPDDKKLTWNVRLRDQGACSC